MRTFLLTWNPKKWHWERYEASVAKVARGGQDGTWSCGNSKRPRPGDRFFHLRQGVEPKGIIGSGWITSMPKPGKHFRTLGKTAHYVGIRWDSLLDFESTPPLGHNVLGKGILAAMNWNPQASGTEIPAEVAAELEELWWTHLKKPPPPPPATLGLGVDPETAAMEGEQRRRMGVHRKREWRLRVAKIHEALIRGSGRLVCEVPRCGFDFSAVYGELGHGFAHVHHTKPLGDRTSASNTKLADLAIVCANCHAMIHLGGECRGLRALIPRSTAPRRPNRSARSK
jgi:5-methylcytosine-specific restriction protein A